jgi:uncharacterized protein YndB with AHSA1/START domain
MQTASSTGRTVEKELFIAAAPDRVYRAFTDKGELERWFVTEAQIDPRPGGIFNLYWKENHVPGQIVALDPPRRMVFTWDDGPKYGVTTCSIDFEPHNDGTLLRLTHTGFGDGDNWDDLYNGVNGGWTEELENLRRWLEEGAPKEWS